MSDATHIVDTSGPVATTAGTGITIISWFATWDWGFLIGVLIGLAGLGISLANYLSNKRFQNRKDQREAEMHELESEIKRLTMKSLEGGGNVKD